MLPQTPLDWARLYAQLGCAPIPLRPKTKLPVIAAWQQLKIPADDTPHYFDAADGNIGVVLGELSGGLTDIDLDVTEAVEAARMLLPETRIFGRQSRPASHYLFKCPDSRTKKYQYAGKMLAEIRSSGAQTMMPGSVHPDGEPVRFENSHKLIEIPFDQLQRHVGQVAAAALLARLLADMNGTRHETCLAAAGALLHGGMQPDAVELFMQAVLAASGDEEAPDRLRAVKDSIKNYGNGKSVSGWPTLSKLLPSDAIEKLREWLDIQDMPALKINGATLATSGKTVAHVAAVARGYPPEPLYRELPEPASYPLEALGDVLHPMAKAMQEIIQAPAALCGTSVLTAAALAVQQHGNIEIDGRICPASLYGVTVAVSGERKSAVDREALAPHRKYQHDCFEASKEELLSYEADRDAFAKVREGILKSRDFPDRKAKRQALLDLGDPPVAPVNPLLLISEPTYEGLTKHLEQGRPSVGLFSDEGGRFIGGHGMNGDNQLKTAAGLSSLWDGSPIDRVRGGDGAILLYGRRLSMHLMLQPAASALLFSNELLMSQGLLSRLLVCRPVSTIGSRKYKAESLSARSEAIRYFARMMSLLEHPLPYSETGELQPPVISLSSDAKAVWTAFHDHVEALCGPEGELSSVTGLAAKAAEQAARIALVLALVDNIEVTEVSPQYIAAGIKLAQFYLSEGLRLYDAGQVDAALQKADMLLKWMQARDTTEWSTRDLYRNGPTCIRSKAAAIEVLQILEQHGWVQQVAGQWAVLRGSA